MIETQRVDPRVRRTRQLLQQAFLTLLPEREFQAITVSDITEQATVNRSTFYAHFTDKYDLMDTLIREQIQDVICQSLTPDAAVTRYHLQALTRAVCEYLANFQGIRCAAAGHAQCEPLIEAAVQEELCSFMTTWLERLPDASSPPEIPTAMAAGVMSWAIFGAGVRWSRDPQGIPADTVAWQVVAALTKGVPSALGRSERLA